MPLQGSTAVIIPWKNRFEILATLSENASIFTDFGIEIVVVNCGGDNEFFAKGLEIIGAPVTVVELPAHSFNRSLAINIGVACTMVEYLFILDADVILTKDVVEACLASVREGHIVTIERLCESRGNIPEALSQSDYLADIRQIHGMEVSWKDGEVTCVPCQREYLDGSHGGQGQLLVSREHLVRINGFNSRLATWGFEDVDILIRLQRALRLPHKQLGTAVHLSHGDEARDLGGTDRRLSNRQNAIHAFGNYARGELGGSLHEDVATWKPLIAKQLYGVRLRGWS